MKRGFIMLQQDLAFYTEILKKRKYGSKPGISLAIVKSKSKDLISAYDPKLKTDIEIQRDLFGDKGMNSLFHSCSVGDIVEYNHKSSVNSIVENLTLRHKLEAFQEAYMNTYER